MYIPIYKQHGNDLNNHTFLPPMYNPCPYYHTHMEKLVSSRQQMVHKLYPLLEYSYSKHLVCIMTSVLDKQLMFCKSLRLKNLNSTVSTEHI